MLLMFKEQVSSPKWKVDKSLIAKLRLIKTKKSKGLKTDPCSTQQSIGGWSELIPLIERNYDWLLR